MSDSLAECIFHASHRVCGRRLRPFSLWHAWLLGFARSPYVGEAEVATPADLALAIEICSKPASSPGDCRGFSLRADAGLVRRIVKAGFRRPGQEFRAYLDDYVALPACWEMKGRPVRSDVCLYSVAVLMRHGRKTEREAWATEFGYARHLVLALAEAGGNDVPIISDAEMKALREAGHL
ncbi:MAG: hypothetical protein FGM22_08295 [Burkholderiaceae bacterium]|nr:hypothetical protein [Burkholderiaceae bacterium]